MRIRSVFYIIIVVCFALISYYYHKECEVDVFKTLKAYASSSSQLKLESTRNGEKGTSWQSVSPTDERKRKLVSQKLREMGLESAADHEFKSPYIRDPKIYHDELTPKAPGTRKTKIISCFNCDKGIPYSWTLYNKDFRVCPYSECYYDQEGTLGQEAAMLLVFPKPKRKPPRPSGQIWVHGLVEPSWRQEFTLTRNEIAYSQWKSVFNWTLGYSQDNDLFVPYGFLAWRAKEEVLSRDYYVQFVKRKSRTAVWWAGHCEVQNNRTNYIKEMQKYIDVDIYGRCGNKKCRDREKCTVMFNETYKFYLAFENSFCKDYMTEKFFRTFRGRTMVIPVVRGGLEYEKYFPPNSFINSKDFKNAKELALYLKDLGSDINRYADLLRQKDQLTAVELGGDWCDVCEMLHTGRGAKRKTIPDVRKVTHNESLCWSRDDVH